MKQPIKQKLEESMSLDIDSGAMHALEDELASINSVRSVKKPLQLFIEDLSNKMFKNKLTSSLVISMMIVCFGLILWSLFFRIPGMNTIYVLDFELHEKNLRVNELKSKLSTLDSLGIDRQIEDEHVRIFVSFTRLAVWLDSVTKRAHDLGLRTIYKIGNSHETTIGEALEVPVTLTFLPALGSKISVFSSSMNLIRQLLADQWHIDIISTNAQGGSQGLSSLQTTIHVWVSDKDSFSKFQLTTESGNDIGRIQVSEEFIQ